jgi:hypothetical protein
MLKTETNLVVDANPNAELQKEKHLSERQPGKSQPKRNLPEARQVIAFSELVPVVVNIMLEKDVKFMFRVYSYY